MKRQARNPADPVVAQPGQPQPVRISDADITRAAQRLLNFFTARVEQIVCNCAEQQRAGKRAWLCLAHGVMKVQ
jgi:hypothetical protein